MNKLVPRSDRTSAFAASLLALSLGASAIALSSLHLATGSIHHLAASREAFQTRSLALSALDTALHELCSEELGDAGRGNDLAEDHVTLSKEVHTPSIMTLRARVRSVTAVATVRITEDDNCFRFENDYSGGTP